MKEGARKTNTKPKSTQNKPTLGYMGQKPMKALTKEQQEYFDLKHASNNMLEHYDSLRRNGKIPQCRPIPERKGFNFIHEQQFYLFMECLQGKHNEFLQSIIDDNNTK